MKVKVISLSYIFQVLYVLCFTRPRYQVSVYRTIGPLVFSIYVKSRFSDDVAYHLLPVWLYNQIRLKLACSAIKRLALAFKFWASASILFTGHSSLVSSTSAVQ